MGGVCSCCDPENLVLPRKKHRNTDEIYNIPESNEVPVYPNSNFLCTICIDETDLREVEFVTCGHVYHKHCLRNWWRKKYTCPVCNISVKDLLYSSEKLLLGEQIR